MVFTIDEINRRTDLLPNITLGYTIHDTCNNVGVALESALNMSRPIEDVLMMNNDIISNSNDNNNNNKISNSINETCQCNRTSKSIIGLVGDAASGTTMKVASIMSATYTPQISYSSTSTDLSSKHFYPSFLRTIPPDNYQAFFIVDILTHFDWKYINLVARDDDYGRVGVSQLLPRLKHYNICIAVHETFDIPTDKERTRNVIARLKEEKQARVIVLWGQWEDAEVIFTEAEAQKLHGRTWIATEAYGSSSRLFKFPPNVVQGLLGIIPVRPIYQPFVDHLQTMGPNTSDQNPWLDEYWTQNPQNCTYITNTDPRKYVCPNKMQNLSKLPPNKYVNVIHAVYALAHSLNNMLERNKINKHSSLAYDLFTTGKYLDFVRNVSFIGKGSRVQFNEWGNPMVAHYSLTNLQHDHNSNQFTFKEVATWSCQTDENCMSPSYSIKTSNPSNIEFDNMSQIQFANMSLITPQSSCRENCTPGWFGKVFADRPCCWTCLKCPKSEVQPEYSKETCIKCQANSVPNLNQTKCIPPQILYFKAWKASGIILVVLTTLAALSILATGGLFHKHRETPVVKAANVNLSYTQLVSMMLTLGMPCLYIIHHTNDFLCGIRLFYFVTFHSLTITVVFTKADRLLKIFRASQEGMLTRHSHLRSNKYQFITVAILTFIGLMICAILYSVLKPDVIAIQNYDNTLDTTTIEYHCSNSYNTILLVLIGYTFIIAAVCGVYAFLARKLPEDYNEAKYTSFSMFTFCLLWVMFVPLYYSSNKNSMRSEIFCYISFISVLVIFVPMYVPKVYVVLFSPQKNTKEAFRKKMSKAMSVTTFNNSELQFHRGPFNEIPDITSRSDSSTPMSQTRTSTCSQGVSPTGSQGVRASRTSICSQGIGASPAINGRVRTSTCSQGMGTSPSANHKMSSPRVFNVSPKVHHHDENDCAKDMKQTPRLSLNGVPFTIAENERIISYKNSGYKYESEVSCHYNEI